MKAPADKRELQRLVEERLPEALRFATRLTGDPVEAEDVLQDALVRALRGWRSFRGGSSARTWLYQIIINVFRDRARRARPHAPLLEPAPDHRSYDPADSAACAELQRLVAQHVSALPLRQREVLVMLVYEGFTVEEAAQTLGISPANVHSTLHHARVRLRVALAAYLIP
jgi:RNA polymerase sigma-70 factor (ECF subfamily)